MIEVNVSPTIISLDDGDNVIEITAGTVIGVEGGGGDLTPVYEAIALVDEKADEALAVGASNSSVIALKADITALEDGLATTLQSANEYTDSHISTGTLPVVYPFNPNGTPITTPTEFVAAFPSTVLTQTSIGSLNNGTSPNYAGVVNYEAATALNVGIGTFTIPISSELRLFEVIFHDNDLDLNDFATITSLPHVKGNILTFTAGVPSVQFIHNGLGNTSIPAVGLISVDIVLNPTNITIGSSYFEFDRTLFPNVSIVITNLPNEVLGNIQTANFVAEMFTITGYDPAVLPTDIKEGDYLNILENGSVLDLDVIIGDFVLYYLDTQDDTYKGRILRDYEAELLLKADKTELLVISGVADQALSVANDALSLAQTNQLNIANKADQADLETTNENVASNTLSIESKVSQVDFDALELVVGEKITLADAQGLINDLVGNAPAALDTIYEIAAQLQTDESAIEGLMTAVGNRVRYDAAQSLTTPQQDQARANIVAEKIGVAAGLIAAITPHSIGAATAAQGTKADTALQSADVAPVALSGAFSALTGVNAPLTNINAITGADNDIIQKIGGTWVSRSMAQLKTAMVFAAETLGTILTGFSTTNSAITATDTVLQGFNKAQGQIDAANALITNFNKSRWYSTECIGTAAQGNFSAVTAIAAGTFATLSTASMYGALRFSSTTTPNSGARLFQTSGYVPSVNAITREIFMIESAQSTRKVRLGLLQSGTNLGVETDGAWLEITDQTATANCATGSVKTTQGSAVLPLNTILYCDVYYATASSVRIVVFSEDGLTKYLDQTISSNVNTTVGTLSGVKAWSTGATVIALIVIDYIGMGVDRPSYIVTPA